MSQKSADKLTYRQRDVHKTLDDHEERLTRNEKTILLFKGAIVGLGIATGSTQLAELVITLI